MPGWFNNVLFISKSGNLFSFKFFNECNSCSDTSTFDSTNLANTLKQIPLDATLDSNNLAFHPQFKKYIFPILDFNTDDIFTDFKIFGDRWELKHANINGWQSMGNGTMQFRYTSRYIPNRDVLNTLDIPSNIKDESLFYFATDNSLYKYVYVSHDGYGSFRPERAFKP